MATHKRETITCEYCSTINLHDLNHCIACGAPISHTLGEIPRVISTIPHSSSPGKNKNPLDGVKLGEKVDEAYFTVMNTYAIAWRTVGEAIAIATASFIIGVVSGSTGMGGWGILGAMALGVAVGLTRKSFIFSAAGAPLGSILGLFLGAAFWIFDRPGFVVFCVTICAIFGAIVGSKRQIQSKSKNWWEKSRPILGALGGLGFGLLGLLIGFLISRIISY